MLIIIVLKIISMKILNSRQICMILQSNLQTYNNIKMFNKLLKIFLFVFQRKINIIKYIYDLSILTTLKILKDTISQNYTYSKVYTN